ncbi:hypothetical protein K449DRAFT_455307 [Hypoxylon sp. EC38]|nr:hypothetical protein K449DRAFT_455307 [Hypoxylon sp. EC38]
MGDLAAPIPVVVCGKVEKVGKVVVEGLKPEYEVILFCLGSQPTAAEVPYKSTERQPKKHLETHQFPPFPFSNSPSSIPLRQCANHHLPKVLRGTAPPTQSSYIGSGNYATPPVAVLMGQAWDEAAVAQVKTAIQGVGLPRNASPVVMRNDTSIATPPPPAPEYAVQLLRRMRETLGKLLAGEKLDGPEEGVIPEFKTHITTSKRTQEFQQVFSSLGISSSVHRLQLVYSEVEKIYDKGKGK